MKPSDINLIKTCEACPEQYDAYNSKTNEQIGYLRLRGGIFTVRNNLDEVIHSSAPAGDGAFMDYERRYYLEEAKAKLCQYYNGNHKTGV